MSSQEMIACLDDINNTDVINDTSLSKTYIIDGYQELIIYNTNNYYYNILSYLGYLYIKSKNNILDEHIKFDNIINYILTRTDNGFEYNNSNYDHDRDSDNDDIIIRTKDEKDDYNFALSIQNPYIIFKYDDQVIYITQTIYDRHLVVEYKSIFKYSTMKIGYPSDFDITKLLFAAILHSNNIYKSGVHLNLFHNNEDEWIKSGQIDLRSIENIFLPKKDIDSVYERIDRFLNPKTKKLYKLLGMKYKLTLLFSGVPGSGKTSFINAIASQYKYNMCNLKYQKTKDSDLICLSKNLPPRSILTLEDLDCIICERKQNDENHITFAGLLSFLDGITIHDGTIIFITTNHKEMFDQALLRPGRVDFVLIFNYATNEQIGNMFCRYMSVNLETIEIHTDTEYLAQLEKSRLTFIEKVNKLCIPITCSIIQQYLINYIGNIKDALSNVSQIKLMYNTLPNNDEHTKLYT